MALAASVMACRSALDAVDGDERSALLTRLNGVGRSHERHARIHPSTDRVGSRAGSAGAVRAEVERLLRLCGLIWRKVDLPSSGRW